MDDVYNIEAHRFERLRRYIGLVGALDGTNKHQIIPRALLYRLGTLVWSWGQGVPWLQFLATVWTWSQDGLAAGAQLLRSNFLNGKINCEAKLRYPAWFLLHMTAYSIYSTICMTINRQMAVKHWVEDGFRRDRSIGYGIISIIIWVTLASSTSHT